MTIDGKIEARDRNDCGMPLKNAARQASGGIQHDERGILPACRVANVGEGPFRFDGDVIEQ